MKEVVILVLSLSFVSALASTANAMRSFLGSPDTSDIEKTALVATDSQDGVSPIVADQPPEEEEHWPGDRE